MHSSVAEEFLPGAFAALRGRMGSSCAATRACGRSTPSVVEATEADWGEEFLALILAVGSSTPSSEAIDHVNQLRLRATPRRS